MPASHPIFTPLEDCIFSHIPLAQPGTLSPRLPTPSSQGFQVHDPPLFSYARAWIQQQALGLVSIPMAATAGFLTCSSDFPPPGHSPHWFHVQLLHPAAKDLPALNLVHLHSLPSFRSRKSLTYVYLRKMVKKRLISSLRILFIISHYSILFIKKVKRMLFSSEKKSMRKIVKT